MRTLALGFALLATLVLATAATASSSDNSPGAVYTLTNSPAGNATCPARRKPARCGEALFALEGRAATGLQLVCCPARFTCSSTSSAMVRT